MPPKGCRPISDEEIAALFGVGRSTVRYWRFEGKLPEPDWVVGGMSLYNESAIRAWARKTGRAVIEP